MRNLADVQFLEKNAFHKTMTMDWSFQLTLLTKSITEKFEFVLFSCDKIAKSLEIFHFWGRRGHFLSKIIRAATVMERLRRPR